MRGSVVRGGVAWGLGVILGCTGADAFVCESDEACQQGGVSGSCQPSGYCSFPDDQCGSGQRYGEHVGGGLAGACVEPGSGSDGGTTDLGDTGPGSTTTSGAITLTAGPVTVADDGPMTTTPVDPSETGASVGTSSGGMEGEAAGTTSTLELVCGADEFDDGRIAATWCPSLAPGIQVDELRGHLRFQLLPSEWGMGDGGGVVSSCDWFPLLEAEVAVELLGLPQVSPYTEAYIELGNDDVRLGLGVLDAQLYAFVWDGLEYASMAWQPYVPDAQRWLRILGTEEGLVAEHSADGMAWVEVYVYPTDLVGGDGWVSVGVWSEMVPLGPDEATFERFEICALVG